MAPSGRFRKALLVIGALLSALGVEPESKGDERNLERKPNRLIGERSPYLLQHAYNPVDWFPWGEEAFTKARSEGKPIFVSIGYSTCHWCHVMERESFEDATIAAYLNEHFVSIKVDREERPDVDAVYMAAVQAQTGHGGWPLSAFLTPDGKPFFTGTYFPPFDDPGRGAGFYTLLQKIAEVWAGQRENLVEQADRFSKLLAERANAAAASAPLKAEHLEVAFRAYREGYDAQQGGFGSPGRYAPKFPRTSVLDFLLRFADSRPSGKAADADEARRMVYKTLDSMLDGGIRDHLSGGFHRYSTDRVWLIPHFEKMLYDQALITRTLVDAYRVSRSARYLDAARETMDYVLARLSGPDGELYSAEDADTEGVEGKTYIWSLEEVLSLLGEERGQRFARVYGVTAEGNFEESGHRGSVLHIAASGVLQDVADAAKLPVARLHAELREDRSKLLATRNARPQPHRDDKVLVEWNGLAIGALAQLAQVSADVRFLEGARRAARFVLDRLRHEGKLLRRWRQGEAMVPGFLEDHAALAWGLLDLFEADPDPRWLEEALGLGRAMTTQFEDKDGGGFFSSGDRHEALIFRGKEHYDGAVPSGNSMALLVLQRLVAITEDKDLAASLSRQSAVAGHLLGGGGGSPESYPLLLCGAADQLAGLREVVIAAGAEEAGTAAFLAEARGGFLPAKVLILYPRDPALRARLERLSPLVEGKASTDAGAVAYVCRRGVCKAPARDVEALRKELAEGK